MLRLFTKNATGVAPDGRWFAGDVNALEDAVAALVDLTQNLEVGSLSVGEPGLQLLRYGAGEARLSGAFRTDGIVRALGGVYAGSFTTTQRDAIANPPYGLVITNSTTNQLEMNYGIPTAPSWASIGVQPPFSTADIFNGAITSVKIAAATIKAANIDETSVATIPIGGVLEWPWASGSIPGWSALPYGQAITQIGHDALATLDTASGHPHGTSTGNIVLPDYRGRIGVGKDDMGGSAANRITVAVSGVSGATLGAVFGVEGITLTTAQLPAHNHGVTGAPGMTDPTHGHTTDAVKTQAGTGAPGGSEGTIFVSAAISPASTGISVNAGSLATANNGSGSAHQNTQPSIIVNKIMRVV